MTIDDQFSVLIFCFDVLLFSCATKIKGTTDGFTLIVESGP